MDKEEGAFALVVTPARVLEISQALEGMSQEGSEMRLFALHLAMAAKMWKNDRQTVMGVQATLAKAAFF
ncbi:hypothetical protein [Achromobacter ruhlandii]|uniref:hypothetical protein n=1 Tax=Achromobacter ruhlandii TaxID=72557 RepID=UPI0012E78242|nr:hypothetical protein [Achromobacter ruhlandii]